MDENRVGNNLEIEIELRRETNSIRAKSVRALQASQEVKKSLQLMCQHLENVYHKLKIDLGELHPLLKKKQAGEL